MTIGDRVFIRMSELGMTQKAFSEATGIAQSTISEWKSKRTNPTSEKIMIICKVLDVTPEWLLSGADNTGDRGNKLNLLVVDRNSELGEIITSYNSLDMKSRSMLMGYMYALYMMNTKNLHRSDSGIITDPEVLDEERKELCDKMSVK